jgi:outer membrane protein OmpA-like peptidoglycan-associated protein
MILCGLASQSLAQQTPLSDGFYVIVGAFEIKKNAETFNASLRQKGMTTAYGYVPSRKIYYVYTLKDSQATQCLAVAKELRKDTAFYDAWVRYIDEDSDESVASTVEAKTIEPVKDQAPLSLDATEKPKAEEPKPKDSETTPPAETKTETGEEVEAEPGPEEEIIQYDKITLANTEVFLSLYNAANDRVVEGVVDVIDTDRGRLIKEVKGNTYLMIPDPKNTSGKISLLCDAFGYRKVQKELNYNDPLSDSSIIEQMGTSLVVSFELVRYQKGDIRTLYNVYFFNDAAVMMPESKFELNEILVMMQENSKFKIRLHGHTNGNYHGKIIKVGPSGDFFSVAQDATTTVGSAKELSESRAGVIKDYLVANGIEATRIDVKAWGGKRPLFDKHSANAKKNIRVEVEIVSD